MLGTGGFVLSGEWLRRALDRSLSLGAKRRKLSSCWRLASNGKPHSPAKTHRPGAARLSQASTQAHPWIQTILRPWLRFRAPFTLLGHFLTSTHRVTHHMTSHTPSRNDRSHSSSGPSYRASPSQLALALVSGPSPSVQFVNNDPFARAHRCRAVSSGGRCCVWPKSASAHSNLLAFL